MHERTTDAAETAIPLPERQGRSYTPGEGQKAMTSAEAERLAGRPRVSREPLARAERLQLTMLAGLFVLIAAMLSAGVVAFTTLSSQILGLQAEMHEEIGGLRTEIGDLRAEMHEEIGGLRGEMREEIGSLREEMRRLSDRTDQLSDRMGQLSERMTRVETLIETRLVPAADAPDPAGP